MNPNIKVFNENLWVVNFAYVQAGYIKDLTFNTVTPNDFITLTNDGKIVMNSADDAAMKYIFPIIKVVMGYPDSLLGTDKGFMIYMKAVAPNLDGYNYQEIVQKLKNLDVYDVKRNGFDTACKWERERRTLEKQYKRNHRFSIFIKNIFKKGR